MSESTHPAAPPVPGEDKKAKAKEVLEALLKEMSFAARLEFKDAADGSVGVAVHPEGEYPGVTIGKRSQVVDALQLIVNKVVNRPGQERRWINLGLGQFPELRPPQGQQQPKGPKPERGNAAPVGHPAAPPKPERGNVALPPRPERGNALPTPPAPPREPKPQRHGPAPEENAEVTEDAEFAAAVKVLAERSAKLGRFFALTTLKTDDRTRALKAAKEVAGVKLHVEGEGRNRRVVFTPEKPTPMPKRVLPDYDDEDEEDDEE